MKVLVAPDKFKGSMRASDVAPVRRPGAADQRRVKSITTPSASRRRYSMATVSP